MVVPVSTGPTADTFPIHSRVRIGRDGRTATLCPPAEALSGLRVIISNASM